MTDFQGDFAQAVRLRDEGSLAEAVDILSRLSNSNNATTAVFAMLGHAQWGLGYISDAIQSFRHATEMSPRSEIVSLGLFHILFEAGRIDEAFDEMRRFLAIRDSAEYRTLLQEINSSPSDC